MIKALIHEIEKYVPELEGKVYPTNAPEGVLAPYLVYYRGSVEYYKTLTDDSEGTLQRTGLLFHVMGKRYSEIVEISDKLQSLLKSLPETEIGPEESKLLIQDVDINNLAEDYQEELVLKRIILDFNIWR